MRKAMGLVAMLSLAGPAAAEPFHHPYGEWREYNRDWLAACPDVINEDATDFYGYSCFASTGSQEPPQWRGGPRHHRIAGQRGI
jgi:hypothetical protein